MSTFMTTNIITILLIITSTPVPSDTALDILFKQIKSIPKADVIQFNESRDAKGIKLLPLTFLVNSNLECVFRTFASGRNDAVGMVLYNRMCSIYYNMENLLRDSNALLLYTEFIYMKKTVCPEGYTLVQPGQRCYLMNTSLVTWYAADDVCSGQASHLLIIDDVTDHVASGKFMEEIVVSNCSRFWTAGACTDMYRSPNFKWVYKQAGGYYGAQNFDNWPTKPSTIDIQNVGMYLVNEPPWFWYKEDPAVLMCFICQYEMN